MDDPRNWHGRPADEVAAVLATSLQDGLAPGEAVRRHEAAGANRIVDGRRLPALTVFLRQFADVMVLVLAGAAVLAGIIGDPQDSIAIVAILLLNAVLGFLQEYRAERAVAALRALASAPAQVRRGGSVVLVPIDQLVPGDLVLLEAGNLVPADLRLTECHQLRVDESLLTGESLPVEKTAEVLGSEGPDPGDRPNLAWRGTAVAQGHGRGIVVATGMQTELGRIAGLLSSKTPPTTPLQQRLVRVGRRLVAGAVVVCALVLVLGLLRREPFLPMLLTAVSLAVAAIPESLPAVVTVALALGARRMARQKALVRRLPAVETLGSVTWICADKTGTLTLNRMQVERWWLPGAPLGTSPPAGPARDLALRVVALCHDVRFAADDTPVGEATEVALVAAARHLGADPRLVIRTLPRIAELPFTAERGCMTTVHRDGDGLLAVSKGSPERLLAGCTRMLGPDGPVALDRTSVLGAAEQMAREGLRVLALAERRFDGTGLLPPAQLESGLTFLGLVGLLDPPRPEAAQAVATCRRAGITVAMITGDHPVTAASIATRLGILEREGRVLTGGELARLPPAQLAEVVTAGRVFARVSPEQKLAIVEALQARGECVAMTGDGINDAPALRRADVGIAMGQGGTDVAREAAPLVLLDDNFATIVSAVQAGRRIYDNLRRFVRYAVTCNAAEIVTLLVAPLLGLPLPLLPIQLLWVNLVTDGLPGIALAAEPAEPEVMHRPPRPVSESIFAGGLWQHVLWVGLLMSGVVLLVQGWSYRLGLAHWRTMTFTVLALAQMGHVLAIRSERESLVRLGLFSNPALLVAVGLTVALQLGVIYLPWANDVFKTAPLGPVELLVSILASLVVMFAVEGEKALVRRGWLYRR